METHDLHPPYSNQGGSTNMTPQWYYPNTGPYPQPGFIPFKGAQNSCFSHKWWPSVPPRLPPANPAMVPSIGPRGTPLGLPGSLAPGSPCIISPPGNPCISRKPTNTSFKCASGRSRSPLVGPPLPANTPNSSPSDSTETNKWREGEPGRASVDVSQDEDAWESGPSSAIPFRSQENEAKQDNDPRPENEAKLQHEGDESVSQGCGKSDICGNNCRNRAVRTGEYCILPMSNGNLCYLEPGGGVLCWFTHVKDVYSQKTLYVKRTTKLHWS